MLVSKMLWLSGVQLVLRHLWVASCAHHPRSALLPSPHHGKLFLKEGEGGQYMTSIYGGLVHQPASTIYVLSHKKKKLKRKRKAKALPPTRYWLSLGR